jgi:hypothetical protein
MRHALNCVLTLRSCLRRISPHGIIQRLNERTLRRRSFASFVSIFERVNDYRGRKVMDGSKVMWAALLFVFAMLWESKGVANEQKKDNTEELKAMWKRKKGQRTFAISQG